MARMVPPHQQKMAQPPSLSKSAMIRDVWAENLESEFAEICRIVQKYPYVAMDSEFPGVVAKPVGTFKTTHEFYYQTVRCNVNLLKLIQLGLSFMNEKGEVPDGCCTWQFNFKFSLQSDIYAQDSIDLLKTSGINFDYFETHGIDMLHFAELLTGSGLVLCDDVTWLSFHSGYDFGYLVHTLSNKDLPEKEEDFTYLFHTYFPMVYDIKYFLRQTESLNHTLGLDALSDNLQVKRIGLAHQAGSDSLMTGHCFFKLVRDRFGNQIPRNACGVLYGFAEDQSANSTPMSTTTPGGGQSMIPLNSGHTPPSLSQQGGAFPSTPVSAMSLVMHGASRDGKTVNK